MDRHTDGKKKVRQKNILTDTQMNRPKMDRQTDKIIRVIWTDRQRDRQM
jgi:hypothetical protein